MSTKTKGFETPEYKTLALCDTNGNRHMDFLQNSIYITYLYIQFMDSLLMYTIMQWNKI